MARPQRIAITGTSGAGKTTLGRELARRLGATFVEVDAFANKAGWQRATDDELRAGIDAALAGHEQWVIDGTFRRTLGGFVADRADVIVWLDLPLAIKLARVGRRSIGRILGREVLWNGNVETWRGAFFERDSVVRWAIHAHRRDRRAGGNAIDAAKTIRLRSPCEVERWLATF